MRNTLLRALVCGALIAGAAACSGAAGTNATPEGITAKIGDATQTVRKDWQRDAMLVSVLIERPDAQGAFSYQYVFSSSASPKLMQLTQTPSRTAMTERGFRSAIEYVPGTRVMDLPRAITIARGAGMKGNLITAELKQWTSDDVENVTVPVVIWRLVPDDDPNIADPNDPNMKNYYVDALLGTVYNPDKPQADQVIRGSQALGAAQVAEMSDYIKSLRQR